MELDIIKKVLNKIEVIIEYVCMGTLVCMVAIIFSQVFCRYILKFTPVWSEEFTIILMIWVAMIGAALGVKRSIHLAINAVVDLFPKSVKRVIYCFDELAVIIFGVIITIYGGKLAVATMDSTLPATQLPSGVIYCILPVMGVLIVFYSVNKFLKVLLNKDASLGGKL
jgi:TRAP-type transport system small permease protein